MDWVVLFLILALVPAQFLLSTFMAPKDASVSSRDWRGGHGLLKRLEAAWHSYLQQPTEQHTSSTASTSRQQTEPPTTHNTRIDRQEYYAGSKMPRRDRTGVKFRVGQVIRHKRYGYRGIIIGWDTFAKAPDGWFEKMGVNKEHRSDPFYSVLVDTRDRGPRPQTTYVWQGNIDVDVTDSDKASISHPEKGRYFHVYERRYGAYVPRDWLRRRYPRD
ncbi:hemimethylated DNA binding domain-containing protein [Salpingoeca rosetta]|uniref:Hemimethylated DNA binding domain-containing protein n=1 Tax=Salpingoeca rosetta (strain ATCC 50818 / BSB-021) TaxID=946362 RepID=F2TYU8_SALR5|nr:hemimethylated DNA binding domain-containing protein [Salpingoeca rosetta]EGD78772.1 hemimethylated DNA binding domain-containing protein [Salpingoeca rosetta]|eukprot:XP_004997728.1 hemimethylated DNA binding domain-containing protein [Salpingoeca rosetta]